MNKDNSQANVRFHLFLLPHQIEYLRRFSLIRQCSVSKVVRDMVEDYVRGRIYRDSTLAPCVKCGSTVAVNSRTELCRVCTRDIVREHNAEDGESDRRADQEEERKKYGD